MKKIFVPLMVTALGLFSPSYGDSFEEGMAAFKAGHCKKAYRIWYMLNYSKIVSGRDGLGLIYLKGCESDPEVGFLKDVRRGIEVLSESNNPELTYVLAEFFNYTPGAHGSLVRALKFYKKAHQLGVDSAAGDVYRIARKNGCKTSECRGWQEKAISVGDPSAKCDVAFVRLDKSVEPANDVLLRQYLEECPPDRLTEALIAIATSLIKDGKYDEALKILSSRPGTEMLVGQTRIKLEMQKGVANMKSAERQIGLAKAAVVDVNLDDLKTHCQKAQRYHESTKNIYKIALENAVPELSTTSLEIRLRKANIQAKKDETWCTENIASLTPDPTIIEIQKGLAHEQSAKKQVALAKVTNDLDNLKTRCQKAKQHHDRANNIYEIAMETAATASSIARLQKRLLEANLQAENDEKWCTETVDSHTYSLAKVKKWHKGGQYDRVLVACQHFSNTRKHEAECKYFLGLMYLRGQGVTLNRNEALYSLETSQKLGYPPASFGLAEYHISEPQLRGLDKAERLLHKLLTTKGLDLELIGGAWYLRGQIEEGRQEDPFRVGLKTYRKAHNYYKKSANFNYWPAFSAIGELYHSWKIGSANHYTRAFENFTIAAENSVGHAQYRLCQYYTEGTGTNKNINKARFWRKKSIENGVDKAVECLN